MFPALGQPPPVSPHEKGSGDPPGAQHLHGAAAEPLAAFWSGNINLSMLQISFFFSFPFWVKKMDFFFSFQLSSMSLLQRDAVGTAWTPLLPSQAETCCLPLRGLCTLLFSLLPCSFSKICCAPRRGGSLGASQDGEK